MSIYRVDPYNYNRDHLLHDLATGHGLTYDEFQQFYGMDVVEADSAVRDLSNTGYEMERIRLEDGKGSWRLKNISDLLE